jgi:hypothetical protein
MPDALRDGEPLVNGAPRALFLTWRTYGTWLPGDARGWVDERNNSRGEPMNRPDHRLEAAAAGLMRAGRVAFSPDQREAVDESIRTTCRLHEWPVMALNVRTNHVHIVLGGEEFEPGLLVVLKKEATKTLRSLSLVAADAPVWSRGGSRRILVGERSIDTAVDYVLNRQ